MRVSVCACVFVCVRVVCVDREGMRRCECLVCKSRKPRELRLPLVVVCALEVRAQRKVRFTSYTPAPPLS